jgi:hypothetical protein
MQLQSLKTLSDLLRVAGHVCACDVDQRDNASSVLTRPEQHSVARCLKQLACLLGQLLGACREQRLVDSFVTELLKQARHVPNKAAQRAGGRLLMFLACVPHPRVISCDASVQVTAAEPGCWPLCAQASLLAAIRLSSWDPRSVQREAAAAVQKHCQRLQILVTGAKPARCSQEQLRTCLWRLRCCRQWVLLFPSGLLSQASQVVALALAVKVAPTTAAWPMCGCGC